RLDEFRSATCCSTAVLLAPPLTRAELRTEHFDREPPGWEGVNNRSGPHFEPRSVEQNFGYSAETSHAGGAKGEIGGKINLAGEPAFYGFRLPQPCNGDTPFTAEGRLLVPKGPG